MTDREMGIGIVAIGRNEGDRLKRCLRSLPLETVPAVYVDSGSTDGSKAFAVEIGAAVVDLDMTQPFTAARARNDGLAALRRIAPDTELVQFIDGDCELDARWLDTAHAFLAQHIDVAVVCGRRREQRPAASIYNRMCDQEWDTPIGEAMACGGDALMRIDAIDGVGCYDPTLTAGEEPELCSRLRAAGWRIWRIDAEMTRHDAAIMHFSQWWRRNVRTGYGYVQAWRRTRAQGSPIFARQIARGLLWGLTLPLVAVVSLIVAPPVSAVLMAIYALQILRIALRKRDPRDRLRLSALSLVAKFPEIQGMMRYVAAGRARDRSSAYQYKTG